MEIKVEENMIVEDPYSGRITGGKLFLLHLAVGVLYWIITGLTGDAGFGVAISCIAFIFLLRPAYVKRLHDINKPGIYALYLLIPAFDIAYLIYLFVADGTKGENKYGKDPKKKNN